MNSKLREKVVILNTEQVQIVKEPFYEDNKYQYVVKIKMNSGAWVRCEPYSGDQKGLVSAMILATDALSGKIWLDRLEIVIKEEINNIIPLDSAKHKALDMPDPDNVA